MHVRSERELLRASIRAAAWRQRLLIEKEQPENSYRLLLLNGQFIDVVRRDPRHLVGTAVARFVNSCKLKTRVAPTQGHSLP